MRWVAIPILWVLEACDRLACRVRGHQWSYGDYGYCRRPFCALASFRDSPRRHRGDDADV